MRSIVKSCTLEQIRRRHMASQQFQQQEYYRNHWFDERERQEHQARDHNKNVRRRSPDINELFEEVIDEGLLELFDWDAIFSNDQPDQDPLYELENIGALGQPAIVPEDMEQSQHNQVLEATEEEEQTRQKQSAKGQDKPKLHNVDNNATTHSLDSILNQRHQIQQNGEIDQSPVMATQQPNHNDQKEQRE